MSVVLQIIGGIVVAFVLVVFLGFLILRWKVKKLLKGLGDLTDGQTGSGLPPMRLRLVPSNSSAWESDEVQGELQAFDDLGYQRISAYHSPDMPGLHFLPYVSPDENSYAVVYFQPGGMGQWVDLWAKYGDGSTLTVTSAPRGGELEHRPGNEKVYLPGSPVEQLVEVFLAKLSPSRGCVRATIEGFASAFETGYAEEMTWRATKGYSDAEVRAVAALDGGEFSEDILQQTKESLNSQAAHQLNEVLRRKYLEDGGVSAAEWEDQRDRIVIVHDRLPQQDVIEEVAYWLDLDEELEDIEKKSDLEPRELMDWINESQPADSKFKKLMTIYEPVVADIWLAPSDPED